MGFNAEKIMYFAAINWFFAEGFFGGEGWFAQANVTQQLWSVPWRGGPRAALAAPTSGYLGTEAALPGRMWSETPPRFCLKRKTKPFNFLACSCHKIFQVIVIVLGFVFCFIFFLSQTQRHVWWWEGWVGLDAMNLHSSQEEICSTQRG